MIHDDVAKDIETVHHVWHGICGWKTGGELHEGSLNKVLSRFTFGVLRMAGQLGNSCQAV